ncbi:MAG: aquaporin, partial [Steroidobacteraceae bacterium]
MRRAVFAEGLGSMLLAAAVIGSGIMAQRLTSDTAVALLANTIATIAVLAVLVAVLAPISGAHFNPAVSLVAWLRGQLSLPAAASYVVVQLIGCSFGAVLAHAMFDLP